MQTRLSIRLQHTPAPCSASVDTHQSVGGASLSAIDYNGTEQINMMPVLLLLFFPQNNDNSGNIRNNRAEATKTIATTRVTAARASGGYAKASHISILMKVIHTLVCSALSLQPASNLQPTFACECVNVCCCWKATLAIKMNYTTLCLKVVLMQHQLQCLSRRSTIHSPQLRPMKDNL